MSVNKVQLANGETIIDISDSTVTPETLAEGVTAHDASGQKITGKMIPGGGRSAQADWNQTDETAADFIKNKPFGDVPTVIFNQEIELTEEGAEINVSSEVKAGDTVTVEWNGTEYLCTAFALDGDVAGAGNGAMFGMEDTGDPFVVVFVQTFGQIISVDNTVTSASVKITLTASSKLARKYFDTYIPLYLDMADDARTYLYADVALTHKVTAGELSTMSTEAPILLFYSALGVRQGMCVYPFEIELRIDVGSIKSSVGVHYTAEYAAT